MSKSLEALENIKREAGTPYFSTLYDIDMWREDFETVEKALKVLEIIKDKHLITFQDDATAKYVGIAKPPLTQEEYDLLKEELL